MMHAIKLALAFLSTSLALSWRDPPVPRSVSHHLSSRTLYKNRRAIPDAKPFDEPLPENSSPRFLYFIARHGTRWPTRKRMDQYASLEPILKAADTKLQPWTHNWQSPFQNDSDKAGNLHPVGESEMRNLGQRFQKRFPQMLDEYHPHDHKFISTQVPRASASASAFAQGLFPCSVSMTPWSSEKYEISERGYQIQQCCVPQPIALKMRPKNDDPLLRFFDLSRTFDEYVEHLQPLLTNWELEMWSPLVDKIQRKLGLQEASLIKPKDVGSLWQLCEQEASLLGREDFACSLFDSQDVDIMEYIEDAVAFAKKGHLCPQAYTMAATLLGDLHHNLAQWRNSSGNERARFHFAHAETIGPLAAALGLFGADQHKHSEQSCTADWKTALPHEPKERSWWANTVMPFGANVAILIHSSPQKEGQSVRMYYNEQVVPSPACPNDIDCPIHTFLAYLEKRASLGRN